MKRYLALIVCLISLCLLLCFPVQASSLECTISEDLQTVYYNGQTYTHINTLVFNFYHAYTQIDARLSQAQQSTYSSISVYTTEDETMIEVTFITPDGVQTIIGYLLDQLVPEYEHALEDHESPHQVAYWDSLQLPYTQLKGSPVTLDPNTIFMSEEYHVQLPLEGTELNVIKGILLINGSDYYYVDLQQNHIVNRRDYYCFEAGEEISAYMITDPELCDAIAEAYSMEYELGLGDGVRTVTALVLALIFGLLPGSILVLSLILGSCSKDRFYQKAWRVVAALSGAELMVFIIVASILLIV